jgi:hypothetical protein
VRTLRSLGISAAAVGLLSACGPDLPGPELEQKGFALSPGLPGVDRAGVISVSEAQALISADQIAWSGAYVGGPCNGGSGWTKSAMVTLSQATNWQYMPIYVGQQASSICGSSTLTSGQGTTDGNDTVTIMGQYAWAANTGIPVCLDVEGGTAGVSGVSAYVQAWATAVHAGGYKAYVYSSPSGLVSFAQAGLPIDGAWIAEWPYSSFQAGLSPYAETTVNPYFTNHNRAWQYAGAGNYDYSTSDLVLAPPPGQTLAPAPTLNQVSGNDAVTVVNWPDGHAEAFFMSSQSELTHVWTSGPGETWGSAASLAPGDSCGSAAIFWPSPLLYAEAFSPLADGGTGHLWEVSGTWNTYQPLGGSELGHLQALTWPDGHTEVFATGAGAVWHQYWDTTSSAWSGWQSLGGTVVSGPSAIVWGDGHADVFATGSGGAVQHSSTGTTSTTWSAWASLGGSLASRPVPVRLASGNVNIYGIGTDGHLYEAVWDGGWPGFNAVDSSTAVVGEPSAIVNTDDSVEVFARDSSGNVVHARNGGTWTAFQSVGASQAAASDPFAWVRKDGTVDVFAVAPSGELVVGNRNSAGVWGSWASLASGAASCAAPIVILDGGSPVPDAGSPGTDAGRSGTDAGGPSTDAGTSGTDAGSPGNGNDAGPTASGVDGGPGGPAVQGCGCGSTAGVPLVLFAVVVAWASRRRRAASFW